MSRPSNLSVVSVPFHGDSIEAVQTDDGKIMVSLKRVCESLGIAFERQFTKLKNCDWATITMMATVAQDGKRRQLTMIDLESLPMWLATIHASKVAPAARPKLLKYQREARAVLAAWFLGTSADRPELAREFADVKARLAHAESAIARMDQENFGLKIRLEVAEAEAAESAGRKASLWGIRNGGGRPNIRPRQILSQSLTPLCLPKWQSAVIAPCG